MAKVKKEKVTSEKNWNYSDVKMEISPVKSNLAEKMYWG